MQIRIDGTAIRNALRAVGHYLLALLVRVYGGCAWLARRAFGAGRAMGRRAGSLRESLTDWLGTALGAERTNRALRRVKHGLVGVRTEVSVGALLCTPLLAFGSGWWVANVSGYRRLESMAVGTWTGTSPEPLVFVGAAALVAVAALFTVFNSGLLPATALSMAPAFGIGFARYGHSVEYYGTVGIPDAVVLGTVVAILVGLPLGVSGFALGSVLRRLRGYFERPEDGEASIRA